MGIDMGCVYYICYFGVIIVSVVFLRKYIEGGQFIKPTRCDGKVVVITGANTGIGKETALELAKRGAKVYLACRSLEKANDARGEIMNLTNSKNVFVRELDLSSMDSIKKFAERFLDEENRLDILINNAGVMCCPKMYTADGFEMQIGVNHLGHFLLTNLLLDLIKASQPSRIINLSSLAHRFGEINREDLNSETSYNQVNAYSQSKLANILFTRRLAKELKDTKVTVNAVHPGTVNTELPRHLGTLFILFSHRIIRPILYFAFKTPKSGAQTTIFTALDSDLETVTGKYFADCKEASISEKGLDDETAQWLWGMSAKLTGFSKKCE